MKHLRYSRNKTDDELFTWDCTNSLNFVMYFFYRVFFSGVEGNELFISLGFRKGKKDCNTFLVILVQGLYLLKTETARFSSRFRRELFKRNLIHTVKSRDTLGLM